MSYRDDQPYEVPTTIVEHNADNDDDWPEIAGTGQITTVDMTEAEKRKAGKRRRQPFGFC